jgi:hypothetical protein
MPVRYKASRKLLLICMKRLVRDGNGESTFDEGQKPREHVA